MRYFESLKGILLAMLLATAAFSCTTSAETRTATPKPNADLPAAKDDETTRTAVLAKGCFWSTEAIFEQLKGVNEVVAGYAGGDKDTATYEKYELSNHAECVRITYDPHKITYGQLLQVLFTVGDPTTKDGQEPDYGHQYRIAVFYENDDQKAIAEAYIKQLTDAKTFDKPITVSVEPMPHGFFPAEDYHQHFVQLHPDHPYVVRWSDEKIAWVRGAFKDWVK